MAPHYRIIRKINWKNTVKDLAHCLAPQQNSILLVIIIVVTSCLGAGPWNPSPQPLPAGEQTPRRLVPLLSPSSAGPFPPRLPRPAPPRPVPPLSSEETFRRLVHRPVSGPRCRGLGAERDGRLRVCAADAGAGARPQGNGELTGGTWGCSSRERSCPEEKAGSGPTSDWGLGSDLADLAG